MPTGEARGVCCSLIHLNIRDTKVTLVGARLALQHFTKLEELDCEWTIKAVLDMHQSEREKKLSLRKLSPPHCVIKGSDKQLVTAIEICPLLDHVDMGESYEPSSQDVKALLKLENLRRLILQEASLISFEEDLLPVLEKFGHNSLDHLVVRSIEEFNLGATVERCSNLRYLSVSEVWEFTESRRPLKHSVRHLPNLQHLEIKPTDGGPSLDYSREASAAELSLLLASAPALVELELEYLNNLSIKTFEAAILQHGFPQLEILVVKSCPEVTRSVVDLLLKLDNPLSIIDIERYEHDLGDVHEETCTLVDTFTHSDWEEARDQNNMIIRYCECNRRHRF